MNPSGTLGKVSSMLRARREGNPDRAEVLVTTVAVVIGEQPYEATDMSINQS